MGNKVKLDLAERCEVSISTIEQWATGKSFPDSSVVQFIVNQINYLRSSYD